MFISFLRVRNVVVEVIDELLFGGLESSVDTRLVFSDSHLSESIVYLFMFVGQCRFEDPKISTSMRGSCC